MHRADSYRSHAHRARCQGFVRLYVVAFIVFFKESALDEEVQYIADFGGGNIRTASMRECKRFCSRHRWGKFTNNGIFPAFKKAERIAFYNFYLVRICNRQHFVESVLLVDILFRMVELDHFCEIFFFVIGEAHGIGNADSRGFAQVKATFAHVFQINTRREASFVSELLPSKCRFRLFIGIVICNILAIARIF